MMQSDEPYDFGIAGYSPNWFSFDEAYLIIAQFVNNAINTRLRDIQGIVSPDGWEPDWPIVLIFDTFAFAINTKSSSLWSVNELNKPLKLKYEGYLNNTLDLSIQSLLPVLEMDFLKNRRVTGCHIDQTRNGYIFAFEGVSLHVFDAGDQLGLLAQTLG